MRILYFSLLFTWVLRRHLHIYCNKGGFLGILCFLLEFTWVLRPGEAQAEAAEALGSDIIGL